MVQFKFRQKIGKRFRKTQNGLRLNSGSRLIIDKFLIGTSFKVFMVISIIVGTTFLFPIESLFVRLEAPQMGEIATEDIIAPSDFYIYKTTEELNRERQQVLNSLPAYLLYDEKITSEAKDAFTKLFADLDFLSRRNKTTARLESFVSIYSGLSPDHAKLLANNAVIRKYKPMITGLADSLLDAGIIDNIKNVPLASNRLVVIVRENQNITLPRNQVNDISSVISRTQTMLSSATKNNELVEAWLAAFQYLIRTNLTFSLELTEEAKTNALNEISRYKGMVLKDERIIRKHERVTQAHIEKLNSLARLRTIQEGQEHPTTQILPVLARFLFIGFLVAFVAVFLRYFKRDLFYSNRKLLLIAVIFTVEVVMIYLIDVQWNLSQYLIPVAIAAMLLTVLFDVELGLLITIVISLLTGVLMNFDFSITFVSMIVGTVASYSVRKVRHRHDFYKPILYLTGTYLVSVYLVESLKLLPPTDVFRACGYGAFNGFISPLLVIALLPLFESVFKITTDITLIELSDLNHPLLKRLSLEAPGTYHHSTLMGTLAEEAAKNINANSLLSRVGAYYHDIGKALKAEYFIENQMGAKNKHEKLTPSMSALILESHVKEGREMARIAGLPKIIIDFIEQHHGDSTMHYFYQKALDMGSSKQEASLFKYPGPKPGFRESAIVMIADSVEAASRTLENPKPARIRNLVRKIIHEKIQAGQLDDSDLTLSDIHKIEDSFVYILSAIFHRRIEYPDKEDFKL
ncbi:MAG: HDIG domain-containing protein [candidate division Zixibacteria bacterium]|nr:HDIG domain-containing protein [candidate division Zixibacteria bacterium]